MDFRASLVLERSCIRRRLLSLRLLRSSRRITVNWRTSSVPQRRTCESCLHSSSPPSFPSRHLYPLDPHLAQHSVLYLHRVHLLPFLLPFNTLSSSPWHPLLDDFDTNAPSSGDKYEEQRRHWGGGARGNKSTEKLKKRAKAAGTTVANAAKL